MESIIQKEPSFEPEADLVSQASMKSGANWFFWIAALSLINSLILIFEGNLHFPVGLGMTEVLSAIGILLTSQGGSSVFLAVTFAISLIITIIFAGIGYYAGKGIGTAFVIGIVLYGLDAVLCLFLGDYLAAGFHAFALFFIVRGFLASRTLKQDAQVDQPST